MGAETTDRYEPLPKDKVKWKRVGNNTFNKWARGTVDYLDGEFAVVRTDSTSGRTSLRSKYRKRIDQLILVERPEG